MSKQTDFINAIGPVARHEFFSRGRDKAILPSVCIAQGALESGWNANARTLFGIKGKGFVATTSEFIDGQMVQVQDSFRTYPDTSSAVVGYYDFIATTPRYAHCLGESDYKKVVYNLQHTLDGLAYATDPDYEGKIISIIEQYGLTEWDKEPAVEAPQSNDTYTVVSGDNLTVIANKFGTTVDALVKANGIKNPNLIYPGDVLKIVKEAPQAAPAPSAPQYRQYTVVSGDSLWAIAEKFLGNGSRYPEIKELNGLASDTIYAGDVLKIPN